MNTFKVMSVNVGKPREVAYQNKFISTAIWKTAIQGPVMLTSTNLAGDGQADLINHGGKDMAVLIYSYDHYDYWEKQLNRKLEYGSFGENVTVVGLTEHDVCIGDTFEWGEAIVQISQPRYPCYKLSIRHEAPEIPQLVLDTGFSGYYVRVLQSGLVSKEAGLRRLQRHPLGISIAAVSEAFINKSASTESIRGILAVDELSESWKRKFESRLT
ncbi:MAG: MOSC domain-containing protein [Paenibacillaceae bacterium]